MVFVLFTWGFPFDPRWKPIMLVELRQAGSEALLDRLDLENAPQPGRWLELEDTLVLQRRHRYTAQWSL